MACRGSAMNPEKTETVNETHIAEVFAFKCTELPGTIIDARGAGISPEGSSGWQRMVHGQSHNVSCFDAEKSAYNGSNR